MAFRLKLVPDETRINFFRWQALTTGISLAAMVASVILISLTVRPSAIRPSSSSR